jgi:hypothetical protein
MEKRDTGFWLVQVPGWFLLIYLVYAQAIPAIDYDLGVAMGTQESADQITAVGAAFYYGFAFADLATYIPILLFGLAGLWINRQWGQAFMSAAFGITIYWPVVSLAAVVKARGAPGWDLGDETAYWIVLPLIGAWAIWGLARLVRES